MNGLSEKANEHDAGVRSAWVPATFMRGHLRRREWIVLDILLAAGSVLVAYALQPNFVFGWTTSNPVQPSAFHAALIYPWFVLLSMHVAGLHDPLGDRRRWFALFRIILAVLVALGLYLFGLYFVWLGQIGRAILTRIFILSVGLLGGSRMLLWRLAGEEPKRIGCMVGAERLARLESLVNLNHIPVELVPVTDEAMLRPDSVAEFFIQQKVDEIVVASRDGNSLVWLACLNRGIQVTDVSMFVEREYYKVSCEDIGLAWFLAIDLQWNHPFYHRVKRIIDVLVSGFGLLLSAPLIAFAALAIIIESGQPIFYTQIRVGFRSKPYRIWKLRTMCTNAEKEGAQWAQQGDTRVTGVGRVLRRTRIDELPQFWNVLKGEMSMIGPRPERPEFVEKLVAAIPLYPQRHWVKPGITGWAQINYPYGASVEDAREKLCYDLYYIKNASILLDFHIVLRTIGAIARGSR
jgi:exopolysaccharide biosynthesis polyprenyl glycosylphosphotransferase